VWPDVAVSIPHGVVNVVVEIVIVRRVNPDVLMVAHVGIQLNRLSPVEVHEFSQVEDAFSPVVLAHNGDQPFKLPLDVGNFRALTDSIDVETALIAQQHVVGLVRIQDICD
jgi:hypothetical protein